MMIIKQTCPLLLQNQLTLPLHRISCRVIQHSVLHTTIKLRVLLHYWVTYSGLMQTLFAEYLSYQYIVFL